MPPRMSSPNGLHGTDRRSRTDRIGVDSAIFIYCIEAAPVWLPIIMPLFAAADSGRLEIVTSSVTLLEVLVVPCRLGNRELAARYESILTRSTGVRLVDISRAHLRHAAQIRAQCGIRTPDALKLSAAADAGCSVFLTNDRRLPSLPGLRIVQLSGYLR